VNTKNRQYQKSKEPSDEDLARNLDPQEQEKNRPKSSPRSGHAQTPGAAKCQGKRMDGWIRLSIMHRARTYSLIPEVTKQLKKLEALGERLGSARNGGGTRGNNWRASESCVNWEGRKRGGGGGLACACLRLLAFELFSFFQFLLVVSFLFSSPL
jgi:hypothetical protein